MDTDEIRTQMGLNGIKYFLQPNGMQGAAANKKNIVDPELLSEIEYHTTSMVEVILRERMHLLVGKSREVSVEEEIRDIHRKMFSPIYDWAGEYRNANVAKITPATKQLTQFAFISALGSDPSRLKPGAIDASKLEFSAKFAQIDAYLRSSKAGQPTLDAASAKNHYVASIAMLFKSLNDLHPFPEGNGRATRLFLERQAIRNGYSLDFTRVEKQEWITASAAAASKSSPNISLIIGIFKKISDPITEHTFAANKGVTDRKNEDAAFKASKYSQQSRSPSPTPT